MNRTAWTLVRGMSVLALSLLSANQVRAQGAADTLSGAISDSSGAVVPNATISAKNVASGQVAETRTNSAGRYAIPNLEPGEYEVSASAEGFSASVVRVRMAAGVTQTIDLTVGRGLSLGDLGFTPAQTQGSALDQARLDKRSHMLKIHQRLGLITTVPLIATVIAGLNAGGRRTSSPDRYAHAALGTVTAGLYFSSAYFAIRAPKIPGTETHGPIRLHKALAWIHLPGMILTPILGAMAFDQRSRGERVHGIASIHGPVAIVTAIAYGASILSVSIKY